MAIVGSKFSRCEIYVPQMLMSAKAMHEAMVHIKPYFLTGETKKKGTFIIGTVSGDLHDIGKNLVSMMVEGCGWEVIDLGVDMERKNLFRHWKRILKLQSACRRFLQPLWKICEK